MGVVGSNPLVPANASVPYPIAIARERRVVFAVVTGDFLDTGFVPFQLRLHTYLTYFVSTMSNPVSPSMAPRPQVYQIDFTAVASGKRIASTKRRIRW